MILRITIPHVLVNLREVEHIGSRPDVNECIGKCMGFHTLLNFFFPLYEHFSSPFAIALSVVSIKCFNL